MIAAAMPIRPRPAPAPRLPFHLEESGCAIANWRPEYIERYRMIAQAAMERGAPMIAQYYLNAIEELEGFEEAIGE